VSFQRNIKKVEIPIFNFEVPVSQNNTFPIQFRLITEDGSKVSAWSNVYEVAGPAIQGGDIIAIVNKTNNFNLSWQDDNNRVIYDVYAYKFSNINLATFGTSRISRPTSTTAQIKLYSNNTNNNNDLLEHKLKVGMRIAVSGFGTNYDIADTYVTSVIDPYTFQYSPVPNTNILGESFDTDGLIQIFGIASLGYSMNVNDYEFVGRTTKNTFSIPKSMIRKTLGSGDVSYTATDIWCLVQPASANQKADTDLDIATGYLAI
jgi:hypothetical protein